jgi:hypothetical protein
MADRLDFEIDVALETGLITGHAGVPGLIEAFRQTGTAAVIDREVKLKNRRRGLSASEMVESLLAMWAAGGERTEDLDQFRQDNALALLLEHELPAAQTARDFLAQFHADDLPLLQEGKAPVAAETAPLLGLAKANGELVLDLQCRRPVKTATLDVDATVIHCDKRAAKRTYDGNSSARVFIPSRARGTDTLVRREPRISAEIPSSDVQNWVRTPHADRKRHAMCSKQPGVDLYTQRRIPPRRLGSASSILDDEATRF